MEHPLVDLKLTGIDLAGEDTGVDGDDKEEIIATFQFTTSFHCSETFLALLKVVMFV